MPFLHVNILEGKQLLDVQDEVKCRVMLVDGKQKGPAQESLYASEISTNPSWQPGDAEFDLELKDFDEAYCSLQIQVICKNAVIATVTTPVKSVVHKTLLKLDEGGVLKVESNISSRRTTTPKPSQNNDDVLDEDVELTEGMKVEARYRGKMKYYPGVIARVRLGGRAFDIDYDDGEQEKGVKKELVRPLGGAGGRGSIARSPARGARLDDDVLDEDVELTEGMKVEARYRGKMKYYPGVIARVRLGGRAFDIDYDDGEQEKGVKKELVRPLGGAGGRGSIARSPARGARLDDDVLDEDVELTEGMKVEARYRGKMKYYPGVIARVRLGGRAFDVVYDDGEQEKGVKKELVRPLGGAGGRGSIARSPARGARLDDDVLDEDVELTEGMKVEARYRGKMKYYPGVIARVRLGGRAFDIDYDDGEQEKGVKKELVRPLGGAGGRGSIARSPARGARLDDDVLDEDVELTEGMKVEARYRGKMKYYPGVIARVRLGGRAFDIDYDDGEQEKGVKKELVRPLGGAGGRGSIARSPARGARLDDDVLDEDVELTEGMKVEARYRGKMKYYPGVIARVRLGGRAFDIDYDDGEQEKGVKKELVRPLGGAGGRGSIARSPARGARLDDDVLDEDVELTEGMKVEARYRGKMKYYPGVIARVRLGGRAFDIDYDDGEQEKGVKKELVRPLGGAGGRGSIARSPARGARLDDDVLDEDVELTEGMKVEARYRGKMKYYPGVIARVRLGGRAFDIDYDDGEQEKGVKKELVRPLGGAGGRGSIARSPARGARLDDDVLDEDVELTEGMKVEARYRGKMKYYPGVIARVRLGGRAFDIDYDDGEQEKGVKKELVRPLGGAGGRGSIARSPARGARLDDDVLDEDVELTEGMKVEARYRGKMKYYPGVIARVRLGGRAFDIDYDDGEQEKGVKKELVRPLGGAGGRGSIARSPARGARLDDDVLDEDVELTEGMKVEARYRGKMKYYPGVIARVRLGGRAFDIDYDDGEQEKGVKKELVRPLGGAGGRGSIARSPARGARLDDDVLDEDVELTEGMKVEARYRGKMKYYPGVIARVRLGGRAFDIDYDDGEQEKGVKKELVRPLGGAGGRGSIARSPARGARLDDDVLDEDVELTEGMKVEARYRGKMKYYPGVIARVRLGGRAFDIDYDDGEQEKGVKKELVRPLGGAGGRGSIARSPARGARLDDDVLDEDVELTEGMKVEARYRGKMKYYPGVIARVRLGGRAFDIDYDDGEQEKGVKKELVRPLGGAGGRGSIARSPARGARLDDDVLDEDVELTEGMKVEARYRGKMKYYPGVIARVRLGGRAFDIDYDDGEQEKGVKKELVRPLGGAGGRGSIARSPARGARLDDDVLDEDVELTEGMKVEARYRGKMKYYPGVIARVRLGGRAFDIDYDDGEQEKGVKKELVRPLGGAGGRGSIARSPARGARLDDDVLDEDVELTEGMKVEARYRGKMKYYPGVIARVRLGGRAFDIDYDDGEQEKGVKKELVRPLGGAGGRGSIARSPARGARLDDDVLDEDVELTEGMKVEARYRGKMKYYPGVIARVRLGGRAFDIDYDDGEQEKGVKKELVRPLGGAGGRGSIARSPARGARLDDAFVVGMKVEARYRGKSRYYPGVISRVRLDGTCDIDYDDGEQESRVDKALIRALESAGAGRRSSSRGRHDAEEDLAVGMKVEARYRGKSRYYPGVISRVRLDGTCDIDYDDGEQESRVDKALIRALESAGAGRRSSSRGRHDAEEDLAVGMKVEARYRGKSRYYPGVISRVRLDGTCDIDYDDGEQESRVDKALIRALESAGAGRRSSSRGRHDAEEDLAVGMKVEARYRGKSRYYPGVISRVRLDGTCDIDYDDGEQESRVDKALIRALESAGAGRRSSSRGRHDAEEDLAVGMKVEARYRGKSRYYPGVISRVRLDGTCDIDYDDGEQESRVDKALIRALESAGAGRRSSSRGRHDAEEDLAVGMKVEARYRGKSRYYPGVISRVRLDGTCDIDYDDGEQESRVDKALIRALESAGAGRRSSSRGRHDAEEDLAVGMKVEARYRGKSRYYPGVISRVRLDGTCDIDYDDGEQESRVDKALIRALESAGAGRRSSSRGRHDAEEDLAVGMKVEARYRGKSRYYPGVISRVRLDGTCDIDYDDGEQESRVDKALIRALESAGAGRRSSSRGRHDAEEDLAVGMKVEARYRGKSRYYPGVISRVRLDGTCDIDYDDGEQESRVDKALIRALESAGAGRRSSSRGRHDAEEDLAVGMKVEARYRGKSRYYPGVISRVRLDGTCDIDYDDGEQESRVDKALIRALESAGAGRRSSSRGRHDAEEDLAVGMKVEARYRGKSRYYPGVISRVRLDGTCDIDYDDGEQESRVDKALIRALESAGAGRRSSSRGRHDSRDFDARALGEGKLSEGLSDMCLQVGDRVEARHLGRRSWCAAVVTKVRGGGKSFDIEYEDFNEYEKAVPLRNIRVADDRRRQMINNLHNNACSKDPLYAKGDRLACYWYRATTYSAPRKFDRPKAVRVIHFNSDGYYTVEFESDGSFLDDVSEEMLEHWATANEKLKLGHNSTKSSSVQDKSGKTTTDDWAAVLEMSKFMQRKNKSHRVPTALELERESNPIKKLKLALGNLVFDEFQDAFDDRDRHKDGELVVDEVIDCFRDLGSDATVHEIRQWSKTHDRSRKPKKVYDFVDFMLLYANLFYPASSQDQMEGEAMALAKTLRIDGKWKDLGHFARSFGKKRLRELEDAFDTFAEKSQGENLIDGDGVRMRAKYIMEAFHRVGKAVTVTRLSDWMIESDVRPNDLLTLADFISVFAYFFGPASEQFGTAGEISQSLRGPTPLGGGRMTLSEIAVSVLQEERWRGHRNQVDSFISRLSAGRSEQVVEMISKIRDGFEALDEEAAGYVPVGKVSDLLRASGLSPSVLTSHLTNFENFCKQFKRVDVSLPDVFQHFGLLIMDVCDSSISVAEALAMYRLHCDSTVIRAAVDTALRIVDNMLAHVDEPKYWKINVANEEFSAKIWRHDSGRALMKALGFDENPVTGHDDSGSKKETIFLKSLKGLPKQPKHLPQDIITSLKSKRVEIEEEVAALEGAPSVSASVREIRQHHSVFDTRVALETVLSIVQNVISNPSDLRLYRVKKSNPAFFRSVGRLQGSANLMRSIGFISGPDAEIGGDMNASKASHDAIYVLKSLEGGSKHFDASKSLAHGTAGPTGSFKFPSLDPATEKFLWRRKADIDLCLRNLDRTDVDVSPASSTLSDTAHISGVSKDSLKSSSREFKKLNRREVADKRTRQLSRPKSAVKKNNDPGSSPSPIDSSLALKSFLAGASSAQVAQINMIKKVFSAIDVDGDGLISVSDIKAYFQALNRPSTDVIARKWIRERDIDQDGVVSLPEFVSSYAHLLDPASEKKNSKGKMESRQDMVDSVTQAFGLVELGCSHLEFMRCLEAVENYVQRILDSPSTKEFWRIKISDSEFHKSVGRLFGGIRLMQAFQFVLEENGTVLALLPGPPSVTDAVSVEVRKRLSSQLNILRQHRMALSEPSISNIAAVSSAIGSLGENIEVSKDWAEAISTVIKILQNILNHPMDEKFHIINPANPKIHAKIGRLEGGLNMLISLGFREEENSSLLRLPLDVNHDDLKARLLEFEVGLDLINQKMKPSENSKVKSKAMPIEEVKVSSSVAVDGGEKKDDLAVKKKILNDLKDEKAKREKAESNVYHQQGLIKELQEVISSLQSKEKKQLSLRQSLTISRLDSTTREKVQKEVEELGRDCNVFSENTKKGPLSSTSTARRQSPSAKRKTYLTKTSKANTANATTSLSRAAEFGDVKLDVIETENFRKGMRVMIGKGTKSEINTIIGFGSLLLEKPLSYSHARGTQVIGFSRDKSTKLIERKAMVEFCEGLVDDVISHALLDGAFLSSQRDLNSIYVNRPIHQHFAILEALNPVKISCGSDTECTKLKSSSSTARAIFARGNDVTFLDFSLSVVGLLNLFFDMQCPESMDLAPSEISLDNMLYQSDISPSNAGMLHAFCRESGFTSIEEMFRAFSGGGSFMNWSSFQTMVRPNLSNVVARILPSDLAEFQSEYKGTAMFDAIDESLFVVFSRLFGLMDCDNDEILTLTETSQAFGELDGSSPNMEQLFRCWQRPSEDGSSDLPSIDFHSFVSLRLRYASSVKTHPGGLRYFGRNSLVIAFERCPKTSTSSLVEVSALRDLIPGVLLSSAHVQSHQTFGNLVDNLPAIVAQDDLLRVIFGEGSASMSNVAFAPRLLSCCSNSASCKMDVAQICIDSTERRAFVLSRDGMVHCLELDSGKKAFVHRLIWDEPLLSRNVESSDRFVKWLGDISSDSGMKEHVATSTRLAQLLWELRSLENVLCVNVEGGLIVANCSITCGAICILDELSLKRIYRIKAPGQLTSKLTRTVKSICNGERCPSDLNQDDFNGSVCAMLLTTSRGAICCQLHGCNDIYCLSLISGAVVALLSGHVDSISCLELAEGIPFLLSGSTDATVQFWNLENFGCDQPLNYKGRQSYAEEVITSSRPKASAALRIFASELSNALDISPSWRRGLVMSFSDGKTCVKNSFPSHNAFEVNVALPDSSMKTYVNHSLLRHPMEATLSPYGPPLWKKPMAQLVPGREVVMFEVDPELAAVKMSRLLAVEAGTTRPVRLWAKMIEEYFDHHYGSEKSFGVESSLRNTDVAMTLIVSLFGFMKIVYDSSQFLRTQESIYQLRKQCDRIMHGGHEAEVVSVKYCTASKYIVSIDALGWCCLWDTSSHRVSLSIMQPFGNPTLVGAHPYSLVARQLILNKLEANVSIDSLSYSIKTMTRITSGDVDSCFSNPLSATSLTAGYELDCSFRNEDVLCRCFVYVFDDLTCRVVKTSSFLPNLVSLDADMLFRRNPYILRRGHNETYPGETKEHSDFSSLQDVYFNRHRLLRIVFVVTCAHSSLTDIINDLEKYGVIQQGFTKTPSDMFGIRCFECRSTSNYNQKAPPSVQSRGQVPASHGTQTGLILEVEGNRLLIAPDFSNDVVRVLQEDVLTVFDRPLTGTSDQSHGFSIGCKVRFNKPATLVDIGPSQHSNSERLFVQVNFKDKSSISSPESSHVIAIAVGRCTIPSLASSHSVLMPSDASTRQLRLAFINHQENEFGIYFTNVLKCERKRAAWRHAHHRNALRMLRSEISGDKGDFGKEGLLSLPTIGTNHMVQYFALLRIALDVGHNFEDFRGHPLFVLLDNALGLEGNYSILLKYLELLNSYGPRNNYVKDCQMVACDMNQLVSKWLLRPGIRSEELCASFYYPASGYSANVDSVDAICEQLEKTVRANYSLVGDGWVGPIQRCDLTISSSHAELPKPESLELEHSSKHLFKRNWKLVEREFHKTEHNGLRYLIREHFLYSILQLLRTSFARSFLKIKNSSQLDSSNVRTISSFFEFLQVYTGSRNSFETQEVESDVLEARVHRTPRAGAYNVYLVEKFTSPFPSIKISTNPSTTGMVQHNKSSGVQFFAWDTSIIFNTPFQQSSFNAYTTSLETLQKLLEESSPVLRVVYDISLDSFSAHAGSSNPPQLILHWPSTCVPLSLCYRNMNGFSMLRQTLRFSVIVANLVDGLSKVHSAGFILRGINLDSILVDEYSLETKFLPSLTLSRISGDKASDIGGIFFDAYLKHQKQLDANNFGTLSPSLSLVCTTSTNCASIAEDVYSLGVCLYAMAFGKFPPLSLLQKPDASPSSLAELALYDYLGDHVALDSQSGGDRQDKVNIQVMFAALDKIHGESVCAMLKRFWSSYQRVSSQGANFLQESTFIFTWEKWIHSFFARLRKGSYSVQALSNKMLSLSNSYHNMKASSFLASMQEVMKLEFNVRLTTQELEMLLQSLARASRKEEPSHGGKYDKPLKELVRDAMTFLVSCFDDIVMYGTLQESVFLICQCIWLGLRHDKASSPEQMHLQNLKKLPICQKYICNTDSMDKIDENKVENIFRGMPSDPKLFVEEMMLLPVRNCVDTVLESNLTKRSASQPSIDLNPSKSSLLMIADIINLIEEILFLHCHQMSTEANDEVARFPDVPQLRKCNVDLHWLKGDNIVAVIKQLCNSSLFPLLVLFVSRFLATSHAHAVDDDADLASTFGSKNDIPSGSLLLLRMAKFFQNCIFVLNSLSRRMKDMTNLIITKQLVDEHDGLSLDDWLEEQELVDCCYFRALTSVITLYCGEEVESSTYGNRPRNLTHRFPSLGDGLKRRSNRRSTALIARHEWSPYISKLFEPLVIDLVGDDGRGSSKVICSSHCIAQTEKLVQHLLRHSTTQTMDSMYPPLKLCPFRSSAYFTNLVRIIRCREVYHSAQAKSKLHQKSQLQYLSCYESLVPTTHLSEHFLPKDLAGESPGKEFSLRELSVSSSGVYNPEWSAFQSIQLLLDLRGPSVLQCFLGDRSCLPNYECLLAICAKVLSFCSSLAPSSRDNEPFYSVGLEFTSTEWVQGLVESLRDIKAIPLMSPCFQLGMKCLYLMSTDSKWLRTWPLCDTISLVLLVNKRLKKVHTPEGSYIKKLIDQTLNQFANNKRNYMNAAVSMRLLSSHTIGGLPQRNETLLESSNPPTVHSLLVEARDLSFGSTLTEQLGFTKELVSWTNFAFPLSIDQNSPKVSLNVDNAHRDNFWSDVKELFQDLTQWMPTLAIPLEVEYSQNNDRKYKAMDSASVISQQLSVIERVLLYILSAKSSEKSSLMSIVLNSLWVGFENDESKSIDTETEEKVPREAGLLYIAQQFDFGAVITDSFLHTRVYMRVISVLVTLMNACSVYELELLCHLGAVSRCLRFLFHGFEVMKLVSGHAALYETFQRLLPSLVDTMRSVWVCCLKSDLEVIEEAILNSDVIRVLIEEWLPDASHLGFKSSRNSSNMDDFQSFLIRHEAVTMIQMMAQYQTREKLFYEVSCRCSGASAVQRECKRVKSTSTKTGASVMRSSAVAVLILLAHLDLEMVNADMQGCDVPSDLLRVAVRMGPLHPFCASLWKKWAFRKIAPTAVTEEVHETRDEDNSAYVEDTRFNFDQNTNETDKAKNCSDGNDIKYDANTQLSYAIDKIGPMILAMKKKFDEYSVDESGLDSEKAIAYLMDLGLKGSHLAACLAEMESSKDSPSHEIEFSALIIMYSRHAGLRATQPLSGMKDGALWVPTSQGLWVKMDDRQVEKLRKATEKHSTPASLAPPQAADEEVPIYVHVEDVPEVISGFLSKERSAAVSPVATGGTVQEAITHLRVFLPGTDSGHFSLHEVAAMAMFHLQGAHETPLEERGSHLERMEGHSWRYCGAKEPVEKPQPSSESETERPHRYPVFLSRGDEYSLPTKQSLKQRGGRVAVSEAEVIREFSRLDLSGEGRLTFLTLKSALELMRSSSIEHEVDDVLIRAWLRDHDIGAKGYVDFTDFRRIFEDVLETDSPTEQSSRRRTSRPNASRGDHLSKVEATFFRYDMDGDGKINKHDLKTAFRSMKRDISDEEAEEWIRKRDSTGTGAVHLDDFLASYS